MRTALALALAIVTLPLSGCFMLVRGFTDTVTVDSLPQGATVRIHGAEGVTPCLLKVPRSSAPRMIEFELEGHEPVSMELAATEFEARQNFGLWLLLFFDANLVLPYLVESLIVDPFYDWPEVVLAELVPKGELGSSIFVIRRGARQIEPWQSPQRADGQAKPRRRPS